MKKRITSIVAVIIALVMVLGACGTKQKPAPETEAKTETSAPVAAETKAPETEAVAEGPLFEETAEVEYYYFCFAPPGDVQHIQDAINAITVPAINVEVHMHMLEVASYMQQIGLMISSGERVDLCMTAFATASYSTMMAQKQLMDITDILEEYGQTILELDARTLPATSLDGRVYAIPAYRNSVSSTYIYMRQDVLEDLGLLEKARNMTSLAEYKEILQAVKDSEKWGYLKPTAYMEGTGFTPQGATTSGVFAESDVYNTLGDALQFIHCDDNGKVSLLMENEQWQEAMAFARELYNEGLMYVEVGDSGVSGSAEQLVKDDFIFSYSGVAEFGAETAKSAGAGMPLVVVELCKTQLSQSSVTSFAYAVPVSAQEPEAAVAFVNFVMGSKEINNLLTWGEEGVDYEVVDGVAQYIEGNEMPLFHMDDYMTPNSFLVYPWKGDTADFRERAEEDFLKAPTSDLIAFSADLSEYSAEMAAVSNVLEEYKVQVNSGMASEATIQEFIDKLYDVDVQVILDAYQSQLDAWLAKQ